MLQTLSDSVIGQILNSTVFWGIIVAIVGLKVYMLTTTRVFISRKRVIGKTAIVTGATSGIGREIAFGLVFRGARIILASRDLEKAKKFQEEIYERTECPKNRVAIYHLDLSSLASVRKFVNEVTSKEERIDILINNAGATALGNKRTGDGLQIGMQINHFAPALLTCLLTEKLKQSAPARIVWVTSKLHGCAKFCVDNLNCEKSFSENQVYFCSKLANILFANILAKKLHGTGITVNTVHPGFTSTKIWNHLPSGFFVLWNFFLKKFCLTTFEAAQMPLYTAIEPHLENVTGKYFSDFQETLPSPKAQDEVMGLRVFEKSLELVGIKPEEHEKYF